MTQEETHQNMSMVAVNIITHGTDDGWLKPVDNQGIGWFLLEIVGAICDVQALMNKPKLFFVNACRGSRSNLTLTRYDIIFLYTFNQCWTFIFLI